MHFYHFIKFSESSLVEVKFETDQKEDAPHKDGHASGSLEKKEK